MVDLNELAGQYSRCLLSVDGVFHANVPAGFVFRAYADGRRTPKAGFVFVVRGRNTFTFNGVRYALKPGTVVHGARDMELQVDVPEAEFEYYLIHYTAYEPGAAPGAEQADYRRSHFALEPGENPSLLEMVRLLHRVHGTPGHMSALRAKDLFYSILYELFSSSRSRLHRESKDAIEQALAYIHEHYMNPLRLRDLADRCGMNAKTFAYLFRKYVGMFPIDYVIRHRMKRASELLAASGCPIGDIAAGVGYPDAHYFSRLYKKHTGCSPTQFRARLMNGPNPPQPKNVGK